VWKIRNPNDTSHADFFLVHTGILSIGVLVPLVVAQEWKRGSFVVYAGPPKTPPVTENAWQVLKRVKVVISGFRDRNPVPVRNALVNKSAALASLLGQQVPGVNVPKAAVTEPKCEPFAVMIASAN
jgi:hypothetical protein